MAQLLMQNGLAQTTPAPGYVSLYSKTADKQIYYKDETGIEYLLANSLNTVTSATLPPPFRNRIINSDMSVNQVNGGTAVTPGAGNTFVTDQFQLVVSQASKLTVQQVADAPAGLKYSTKISVASQFSPGAADYFNITQQIEGQNIIDFQLGTAGAVTIVTSQWIKGSVAGTYSVTLRNGAANRSYVGTVSVTTAWQRLSISLIGDTTGTWATDTTSGLIYTIDLGSGSTFNTTAGSWQAGLFLRTAGSVTFVNQTAGSTLNITGVQVEAVPTGATQPTAFEFLPYETQLSRAQRYLYVQNGAFDAMGYSYSTVNTNVMFSFPVVMRVAPTGLTTSALSNFTLYNGGAVTGTPTALSLDKSDVHATSIAIVTTAGSPTLTPGQGAFIRGGASAQLTFTGAQL